MEKAITAVYSKNDQLRSDGFKVPTEQQVQQCVQPVKKSTRACQGSSHSTKKTN